MRYEDIGRVMARVGLASEPAFQKLAFVLETIPCMDGCCPLGLYDPDYQTIILPPDFTEGALLHELGHRYEHYYYGNDLSEDFAEDFRKHYSHNGKAMLGYFPASQFTSLARFEPLFQEGERGAVEMHFYRPLDIAEELMVWSYLSQYPQFKCTYNPSARFLRVQFTKGVPALPIILGIGAVIVAGMLGFGLFKVQEALARSLIPMALIAGGSFVLYGLAARKG